MPWCQVGKWLQIFICTKMTKISNDIQIYMSMQRLNVIFKNHNGLICWNDRILQDFSFLFILLWSCKNCFAVKIIIIKKRWPIVSVGVKRRQACHKLKNLGKACFPKTKEFREEFREKARLEQGLEGLESNYHLKMNVSPDFLWKIVFIPGKNPTILLYIVAKDEWSQLQPWNLSGLHFKIHSEFSKDKSMLFVQEMTWYNGIFRNLEIRKPGFGKDSPINLLLPLRIRSLFWASIFLF